MFTINRNGIGKVAVMYLNESISNDPNIFSRSEQDRIVQGVMNSPDQKKDGSIRIIFDDQSYVFVDYDKFNKIKKQQSLNGVNLTRELDKATFPAAPAALAPAPVVAANPTLATTQSVDNKKVMDKNVETTDAIKTETSRETAAAVPASAPTLSATGAIRPATRASISQMIVSQKDISTSGINFFATLNDADPAKKLDNRLKVLSDFDGASGVEKNNKMWGTGTQKYIVGEMQIYNILKDTLKTPEDLTALMSRFGIAEDWNGTNGNKMRDVFRDTVIQKADDVASISRVVM